MKEEELILNAFDTIPLDSTIFVTRLTDIADRIQELMDQKGWSQKDLSIAMGKKESEISKWLTTMHNFTLRSIAKMEATLGADIIQVPLMNKMSSAAKYVNYNTQNYSFTKSIKILEKQPDNLKLSPGIENFTPATIDWSQFIQSRGKLNTEINKTEIDYALAS